jgi:glycosyltransferase involved in cell wall biosynthesis
MILLLHNRYRTTGGEERAVADLRWLVSEHLGEAVEVLERDSADIGPARAAAGMLRGGLEPGDVADAVRRTGARVVHAHNVNPAFGRRGLEAARAAGARVVLHLHNYRLVCAPGTCFTRGEDCTRCHGRNTWPGVRLNCRGSRAESAVYAAGIARHQRGLAAACDAFVVPSEFALGRLRELGAPLGDRARAIASVQREFAAGSGAADGEYALYAGRLSEEKGVDAAIRACATAGVALVIAGTGPAEAELRALAGEVASRGAGSGGAASPAVRFTGLVSPARLGELRARAGLAIVPSRYAEIFPLAAAEAMAAGLPTVAFAAGGLGDFVPEDCLAAPGDEAALAERVAARFRDAAAGERALAVARARCAPEVVAAALREVYDGG